MNRRRFKWYEFFAGGGMARLGLGDPWECVFANDSCERKASAYRARFGPSNELIVQDVARLSTSNLPGVPDLVWASFPCQDLSLAGNGVGLKGKRSGTFLPFWKLIHGLIAEQRKPHLVVLENVVGAITSHAGKDFAELIRTVAESGYRVGPLVMDAVRFLPQSRPRLFIVAVDERCSIPDYLLSAEPEEPWHHRSLATAYSCLPATLQKAWVWWRLPTPTDRVSALSSLIEESPTGVQWHSREETLRLLSLMSRLNREKVRKAQSTNIRRVGTIYKRTRPIDGNNCKRKQRAEVRFDEIAGCLRTPVGGSSRQTILVVEGRKLRSRLLSPREAARLMGVPEDYPIPEKYNEAYHVFGDGLAVPVVKWLEIHLLYPLAQSKEIEQAAKQVA